MHGAHISVKGTEAVLQRIAAAVCAGNRHAARFVRNEHVRIFINHAHPSGKPRKRGGKRRPCAAVRQAGEGHGFLFCRVFQREGIGPKRDLLAGLCQSVIALIAPDGRFVPGHLYADLVVPPCVKADVEQGKPACLRGKAEGKGGGLCAGRIGRGEACIARFFIPKEPAFQFGFLLRFACNERTIALLNAPVTRKCSAKARRGLGCARKRQHAANGSIQPVDEAEVNLAGLAVFFFDVCLCKREKIHIPGGIGLHGDVYGLFHHKQVVVLI